MCRACKLLYFAKYILPALLLLAGFFLPAAAADHQIVVIADPHVMVSELLIKDGKAFQKYNKNTRRMCDYSKAIFDQAVKEILSMSPKPELVLIPGDISKDGELVNHLYVKGKLDELKKAGIYSLVVPGNHDWGKRPQAVYYDGDSTYAAVSCVRFGSEDNSLETIYSNYGFKSYYNISGDSYPVERESVSKTLTYACEPIKGLYMIGIDSGNNGVLSKNTLDWICTKARAASKAGKQVIAMMHYPIITLNPKAHIRYPSKKDDKDLTGYKTVRNRLADAGISVIFTAHTHINEISKDWNGDFTREIYDITTGSICSYPCYYRIVTLSKKLKKISVATYSIKTAGSSLLGRPFNEEVALSRFTLKGFLKSMEKQLIANGVDKNVAPKTAAILKEAHIYNGKGEENNNANAKRLLSKLNLLLFNVPTYLNKYSILLSDISNYGDPQRQNQTDDNTLVITLSRNENQKRPCSDK